MSDDAFTSNMSGGIAAGGHADLHFDHIYPVRSAYHRFGVGDPVFVRDSTTDAYRPRRVKGMYYLDKQVYYRLDDQRLVAEKDVLSHDEYLRRLDPRTTAPPRNTKRQLSVLKRVPPDLVRVGDKFYVRT